MKSPKQLISIVIPTLNEEGYISKLLMDLTNQTRKADEITIVDGYSKDKTVEISRKIKGVSVFQHKPSIADQRNSGALKSKGGIIFFLDADVRLSPNFIKNSTEKFNKADLDIGCPFFTPYQTNFAINTIFVFFNLMFFIIQKVLPSGAGTCLIVKASVFKNNPGFNAQFKFEDIEYIRRMGRIYKFGIINEQIGVSDRRFRKNGFIKTAITYLVLSLLFVFGLFKIANVIDYKFGDYNE